LEDQAPYPGVGASERGKGCSGTPIEDPAFQLALSGTSIDDPAFQLAVSGTSIEDPAFQLALSGASIEDPAFQLALSGTSAGNVGWAAGGSDPASGIGFHPVAGGNGVAEDAVGAGGLSVLSGGDAFW